MICSTYIDPCSDTMRSRSPYRRQAYRRRSGLHLRAHQLRGVRRPKAVLRLQGGMPQRQIDPQPPLRAIQQTLSRGRLGDILHAHLQDIR